jgi:hypothetical protein
MTTVPRPSSSLIAFWAVLGVAVLFLGDSVVRGNWHVVSLAVAPIGLIVWAAWIFLYRPRISFDRDTIVVVNPGRILEIPWQRVSGVRQRFQILLELDDGSTVTCWGSPFPEKPGRYRPTPESRRATGGGIVEPLDAARVRAEGRSIDVAVVRRVDLLPDLVGGVLVVICVFELVAAR